MFYIEFLGEFLLRFYAMGSNVVVQTCFKSPCLMASLNHPVSPVVMFLLFIILAKILFKDSNQPQFSSMFDG
jgi:hypothetical protein